MVSDAKTDKLLYHGYQRIYPYFLDTLKFIARPVRMLEIGLQNNDSIKLWQDYFGKDTEIFGADINPKYTFQDNRNVRFIKCDQSKVEDLLNLRDLIKEDLDFIIDDGSHIPEHQMLTLITLWPKLRPRGVYIIEDVETSFWKRSTLYGYDFNSKKFSLFLSLLNSVKYIVFEGFNKRNCRHLDSSVLNEIEIISFGYNSIVLVKKDPVFDRFYNRVYRFNQKINYNSLINKVKRRLSIYFGRFVS